MYINLNSTVVVQWFREPEVFVVHKLDTHDEILINPSELLGVSFKYLSDFIQAFQNKFEGINEVLIYPPASQRIKEIMEFNRIEY